MFLLSLSLMMESLACHITSSHALQPNAVQGDELPLESEFVPSAMKGDIVMAVENARCSISGFEENFVPWYSSWL